MSEQGLTKEQVSLAMLKASIEKVVQYRNAPLEVQLENGIGFCAAERDAWRDAYLWRVGFTERWRAEDVLVRERDHDTWVAEEKYGTDLISEILDK